MKKCCLFVLSMMLIPILANAGETKVLFYQYRIPGPQISKDYYIKESIKKVDPKNPHVLEVRTYSKVTSPEGTTEYRVTRHINCQSKESTIVKHWSTGFGDDPRMADGKWRPVADYKESLALAAKICPKN